MFWKRKDRIGVRSGNWKWVVMDDGEGLYNLASDISEENDVSSRHPEKLAELKEKYIKWSTEMNAAEPRGPFRDY